jgi:ABC-2 type transport system ATP-binding protein
LDREARARIGYMPEERGLYPKMRVSEQLDYLGVLHGLRRPAARAATAMWLERLGLGDRADARIEQLSLGNQQRVQLAAALVHQPDLLVLDEPFSGLDPIVTDILTEVLRAEADRGVPVLFSSHQLELVEHVCESVAIIDAGRLVACGAVDELRNAGPQLVRIMVKGARPGWPTGVEGARLIDTGADGVVFELTGGAQAQDVLDAGRRSGTVSYFAEERPTLAELFRELVAA